MKLSLNALLLCSLTGNVLAQEGGVGELHEARAFLLIGQSNMQGFACDQELAAIDPALDAPIPDVFIYNRSFSGPPPNGWETLEAGTNTNFDNPGYFGPEVSLGIALRDHFGGPVYLIKYGIGSTFLTSPEQCSIVPAAASWNPSGGDLYDDPDSGDYDLLAHLEGAKNAMPSNKFLNVQGVFWVQGAHDSGNADNAGNYEANLRLLISTLRGDLVAGGLTPDPVTPFAIGHTAEYFTAFYPPDRYFHTVRCAQQVVSCTTPRVGIFDPLTATPNNGEPCYLNDLYHMDAQSQLDHGTGLFGAFIDRSCPKLSLEDCSFLETGPGGSVTLQLSSPQNAGRTFVLAGSSSGYAPGIQVPAGTIPLNPDAYFSDTTGGLPTYLQGNIGTLDAGGQASVTFTVPPMHDPSLHFGQQLHHAFVVLDETGAIVDISNPFGLTLHNNLYRPCN